MAADAAESAHRRVDAARHQLDGAREKLCRDVLFVVTSRRHVLRHPPTSSTQRRSSNAAKDFSSCDHQSQPGIPLDHCKIGMKMFLSADQR
jgi:hypothetical protein